MIHRSAEFSPCGFYRYRLDRWWGNGPRVGWLMCNPSDASADQDDPTVRKCMGFTSRWEYQGFTVINPFALVLTDPRTIHRAEDPVGPRNGEFIDAVAGDVSLLIVAWGCETTVRRMVKRGLDPLEVVRRIRRVNPHLPIECLGRSENGNPYHPLMLAYSTRKTCFEVRG